MKLIKAAAILATAGFLAACAQPEPVEVMAEPTYDKYGNVVE